MKKVLLSALAIFFALLFISGSRAQTFTPQLLGVFHHYWEPSQNSWLMEDSISYKYDPAGRIAEEIMYFGDDPFTGAWTAYFKHLSTYNNNGSIKLQIGLSNDSAGWDTTSRTTYTYNANNQLILESSDNFIAPAGWQNASQIITGYDGNGNKISEITQSWNHVTNSWGNDNDPKLTYAYDSNNYLIADMRQSWDTASSGYKNIDQNLYTNYPSGLHLITLHYVWDGVSNWYPIDNDSTIYNASSQVIENHHRYRHQGGTDQWGREYRESYTYGPNGKITEYLSEPWDFGTGGYGSKNSSRITSLYNADYNIVKSFSQNWDSTSAGWKIADESMFYYSIDTNATAIRPLILNKKNDLYPNPFRNSLTLETAENENTNIHFFDLMGKEVKSITNKQGSKVIIDTQELPAGVYLVKLTSGNKQVTRKMIKME